MKGKPGGAVITCAVPCGNETLPPASEMGVSAVKFYMMEEGMNFLGAVRILGNVPCVKCGRGDECGMSGLKMLYGSSATVDSVGINTLEEQPEVVREARELGERIAEALNQN